MKAYKINEEHKSCLNLKKSEKAKMRCKSFKVFISLFVFFFIAGCVETEQKAENLWRDMNIEYLKQPATIAISLYEQSQIVSKIDAIDQNARLLQKNSSGMMAQYWQLNSEFANFLKKKLEVMQSRRAWLMHEKISFDINSASRNDCNMLLAFAEFARELDALADLAKENNEHVEAFMRAYNGKASQLNVSRFVIDVNAIRAMANKAKALALLGKECSLYLDSKEFFETLSVEELDCNTLQAFSDKISKAEGLADEAKKLMEELTMLGIDTEALHENYIGISNALAELKRLYSDFNSC